jgi:hypothetical protein
MYSQIANHASHIISWLAGRKQEKAVAAGKHQAQGPTARRDRLYRGGNPVSVGMAGLES